MRVLFLSRPGCTLCAESLPAVQRATDAGGHVLEVIDITGTTWEEHYADRIPVVIADGAVVLAGKFSDEDVARALG